MTVMPNTAKKTQLRQEAQARRESAVQAEQRLQALSQEATDLPGKLREAVQQAAKQRAEAARNGGSAAAVAADLDLTDLRQRQDQVELELWAQRIAVEEGRLAMYEAEDALAVEEHREAQARFERIKPKFEEMRREYETARSAALRDGISTHRMNLKKESRAKLAELEVNYPGA